MARLSPRVHGATLVYQQQGQDQALQVGTPDWFAWLATASTFAFRDDVRHLTARKERAGNQRGGWYWKAYRTQHGRLASIYLGKSEALTLALSARGGHDAGPRALRCCRRGRRRVATVAPSPTRVLEDPLLATKLHMPRPPAHLVPRAHLTVRLQQALEARSRSSLPRRASARPRCSHPRFVRRPCPPPGYRWIVAMMIPAAFGPIRSRRWTVCMGRWAWAVPGLRCCSPRSLPLLTHPDRRYQLPGGAVRGGSAGLR